MTLLDAPSGLRHFGLEAAYQLNAVDQAAAAGWVDAGWTAMTVGLHPRSAVALLYEVAAAVGAPAPDHAWATKLATCDDRRELDAALAAYSPDITATFSDHDRDPVRNDDRGPIARWRDIRSPLFFAPPLRGTTFDAHLAALLYHAAVGVAFDPDGGPCTFGGQLPGGRYLDGWRELARMVAAGIPDEVRRLATEAWRTTVSAAIRGARHGHDPDAADAATWMVAATHGLAPGGYDLDATGCPTEDEADQVLAAIAGPLAVGTPGRGVSTAINVAFRHLDEHAGHPHA